MIDFEIPSQIAPTNIAAIEIQKIIKITAKNILRSSKKPAGEEVEIPPVITPYPVGLFCESSDSLISSVQGS